MFKYISAIRKLIPENKNLFILKKSFLAKNTSKLKDIRSILNGVGLSFESRIPILKSLI